MSLARLTKLLRGIRFRLTLVYSTLFGLFICTFAYVFSHQYFQTGREDFDSRLFNYAVDLSEFLEIEDHGLRIAFHIPVSEEKKIFPFILNRTYHFVRSLDGKILMRSQIDIPFDEIPYNPALPLLGNYTHRFHTFPGKGETFRAVNVKIIDDLGREMILQVATPYNAIVERENTQLLLTFSVVPVLIFISSLISYFMAGNALDPIKSLTETANTIAAKNLSLRVPESKTGDEVEELGKTLNNLLERLEKSFKAQEHFVANASHQLNTPLAIIKGELDVLESRPRTLEEQARFHKSLREELERLIELVKNMLLVSRVESGLEDFIFHPLRLDDILLSTSSRLAPKAKEKRITVRFNIEESLSSQSLQVNGEKQLLESMFENILDNAIKYSPEESVVSIDLKGEPHLLSVWIQDEGPGISPAELEEILKGRFKRGPSNIPGTGIGLSIAYKIAQYHFAKLSYERRSPKGSTFIIQFPTAV
jgi:signal transduction histidine kinase